VTGKRVAEIQIVARVIDQFEGEHGMDGNAFYKCTADGASEAQGLKPGVCACRHN